MYLEKLFSSPTVTYCEQASNWFIARPGYAFSNIPYILLGIWILWKDRSLVGKLFGISSILIGLFSFIYDATYIYLSQIFDLGGMFVFILILLYLNISRLQLAKLKKPWIFITLFLVYILLILCLEGSSGRILFGLGVIAVIALEIYIFIKNKRQSSIKFFIYGLSLFVGGWLVWLLDANKIWCDPSNLLNGRAIFHYMTTITILLLWRHYHMAKLGSEALT